MAGQCMTYYHYKIGDWKYYDSEGRLFYQVNYQPEELHVDTRCEDGDVVTYGLIKDPSYLKEVHKLSPDSIYALQEVVIEDEYRGVTILKPMDGKLVIDFKIKKEKLGIIV